MQAVGILVLVSSRKKTLLIAGIRQPKFYYSLLFLNVSFVSFTWNGFVFHIFILLLLGIDKNQFFKYFRCIILL